MTWRTFLELDEDDGRELVAGVLVEGEVPTKKHEWIVATLIFFLTGWVRSRNAGTVLGSGYKLRIDDKHAVMPDLLFIRRGRGAFAGEQGMQEGAPDLVVEVISPGSRRQDSVRKLQWYAKIGVPEYWLFDATEDTLERLTLGPDGHFVISESLEGAEVFRPPSFAGLEIPLQELWSVPED
ncbi:MAG: Uma2 family endonuclease [Myxococcaceae bacterium]